jgi:branched-chain amino acid transport system permease protein
MAQNREGASLVGIDANRVAMLTFAVSGVLAAFAATLYAPINLVYPAMGHLVITKAFVIIILGGMGSFPGAIVGGLIIGLAEAFGGFYFSTDYKDLIAFVLLVVILSVRPQGLFSKGAH